MLVHKIWNAILSTFVNCELPSVNSQKDITDNFFTTCRAWLHHWSSHHCTEEHWSQRIQHRVHTNGCWSKDVPSGSSDMHSVWVFISRVSLGPNYQYRNFNALISCSCYTNMQLWHIKATHFRTRQPSSQAADKVVWSVNVWQSQEYCHCEGRELNGSNPISNIFHQFKLL